MQQQQGRTHFGVAIEFMNTWGAVASTNHTETVQWGRYVCNKSRLERRRQEILAAVFLFSAFRFDCSAFWMWENSPGFSTWGRQQSPAQVPTLNSATHQLFSAAKSLRPSCHCLAGTQSQPLFLVRLPAAPCHLAPPSWAPDTSVDFPVGLAVLGKVRMCTSCFTFPSCSAS